MSRLKVDRARRETGFTLVEILVVIGIVAILISLLLPMISGARRTAKSTACLAQLRDIGNMYQMYLNDNHLRVMRVNPIPSDQSILPYPAPSIVEVLQPYHRGATQIFHCPADSKMGKDQSTNARAVDTYFEQEGTSYEYNVFFNAFAFDEITGINKVWPDALAEARKRPPLFLTPDREPLLVDFEPFHAKSGTKGGTNAVYADFHAAPLDLDLSSIQPR